MRKVGVCSEAEEGLSMEEVISLAGVFLSSPVNIRRAQCGAFTVGTWPLHRARLISRGCCFSVGAAGAGAERRSLINCVLLFFPLTPPYPQGLLPHLKSRWRTSEKKGEGLCSSSYLSNSR